MIAATEQNPLLWMQEIAVKCVHMEVHRTQFVAREQKQCECLNAFHGLLKSEASLCDFCIQPSGFCLDTDRLDVCQPLGVWSLDYLPRGILCPYALFDWCMQL